MMTNGSFELEITKKERLVTEKFPDLITIFALLLQNG